MKRLFNIGLLLVSASLAVGCFNEDDRNYQYFPNMYESVGYEAYGSYEVFENSQEAKLPVEGTVPRGWKPYGFEDSNEGYQNAKASLTNPLPYTEDNVNEGKALYTIYCAICHGDKGDGKGTLAQREKILGIPAYNDAGRAITEGSVYHVMFYGLNTMGSYAAQTSEEERWKIDHYVMDLKRQLNGAPKREFVSEEEAEMMMKENASDESISGTEMSEEDQNDEAQPETTEQEDMTEGEQENTEVNQK
ncbi:cytochrome c [Mesonia sp.]|uniref:c-type cytochrome n=1 Tax=Mesonia sp. TaxID=1960830 RepID=UPI00174FEAA4|nr:cytochrome c [Mesonia sp.]HIB36495.1 cytochrome c [Mesonia sp.]HIO26637.1 cytochrome c [Flavobacteriaceae bacterium]